MQHGHEAATDARALRFHHRQRGRHRDRRIKRIAALGQYFEAGVGGEEIRTGNRRVTGALLQLC